MKNVLHRAALALALIAGFTPAVAQQFPTVPGQSVIGRLGIPGDSGPSQAIPLSTLGGILSYTAPYTGAVPIPQRNYNAERLSVIEFSADPTGVADATVKIQSAMTAAAILGKCAFMPAGTYKISGTVNITGNGACLEGEGINSTILKSPNAANTIVAVGNGLSGVRLSGFQLNRTVAATSGGDGIQWAITGISDGFLDNIWARNSYVGFHLGPTSLSWGYNLRAEGNVTHGFLQTNNAAWGGNQWTMTNIYAGNNGIDGYCICSDSGAVAGMGTGNMTNVYSFANGRHGLSAIGTVGSPINSLRLFNVFLGQDNASELYLDSRGGDHQINGGFYELAGTSATGPGNATPASHVGHGIEITANNVNVMIANVLVNGMSQSGIKTAATAFTTISGSSITNNSNFGVLVADGTKASLSSSRFTANTSGDLSVTANSSSFQSTGNTPSSINNMLGPYSGGTVMTTDTTQTVSGVKTFLSGTFGLAGGTSGTAFIAPALVAAGTSWTLPVAVDSFVGNSLAAVLANKSMSGAANTFTNIPISTALSGFGTGIAAALAINTGSAGAPVLFNGALGTPSSGVGSNLTALNATQLTSGTVPAARTNGHMNGTATNDNGAAGEVGEYTSSTIASGSAVALTTNTPANVTSISLTAGDWDVDGLCQWSGGGTTTVINQYCSISTTTATIDTTAGRLATAIYNSLAIYGLVANPPTLSAGPARFSVAGTTTVFMVAQSSFGTSTESAFGLLRARRVR